MFLEGLNSPFGMALVGNDLYVANTDAVVRFPYTEGETRITAPGVKVADLPGRAAQSSLDQEHHREPRRQRSSTRPSAPTATSPRTASTRRKAAPRSGRSIRRRASIAIFASGLRNPNGMAWEPESGALWTVVNERDELGSDLVPDYLTSVKDGAFLRLAVQLLRASTSTTA